MVDFAKRARGTGDLDPDEEIVAASNVTPSPFSVANAGLTGGLIAGGAVGAAVGATWDSRRRKKDAKLQSDKQFPAVAARQPIDNQVPTNGALLAVTTKRICFWKISAMGKPKELLFSIPHDQIDGVWWEDADTKWLAGKPASLLLWIGIGDRVLSMAGISMGAGGKSIRSVVAAMEERLPGKVRRFEAGESPA